jgi:hypothetical protein
VTKRVDASSRKTKDDSERRVSVRIGMLLLATIKYDDMLPSTVSRVLDLSGGGIRTTLPVNLKRGHPVRVILKGVGELRAKIAWTRGGEVGIKFDSRINTDTVVQALTGAPAASHIEFAKAPVPRPGFHVR